MDELKWEFFEEKTGKPLYSGHVTPNKIEAFEWAADMAQDLANLYQCGVGYCANEGASGYKYPKRKRKPQPMPEYNEDNPPRLRKPTESVEEYRKAMGWTTTPAEKPKRGRPATGKTTSSAERMRAKRERDANYIAACEYAAGPLSNETLGKEAAEGFKESWIALGRRKGWI